MPVIEKCFFKNNKIYLTLDDSSKLVLLPDHLLGIKFDLSVGSFIAEDDFFALQKKSKFFEVYQKALTLLANRSHSVFELKRKLINKKYSEDIIDEVLQKISSLGYLNDFEFAENFVKSKLKSKVIGKNLLKSELFKRGINSEIINRVLEENYSEDFDNILQEGKKKYSRIKTKKKPFDKVFLFLKQRGFDSSVIIKVISEIKNQEKIDSNV